MRRKQWTVLLLLAAAACNAPEELERIQQALPRAEPCPDCLTPLEAEAQRRKAEEERLAYVQAKYPRERGQAFSNQGKTLKAAIIDVWINAWSEPAGPFEAEWVAGVYKGKYDDTYYFEPRRGIHVPERHMWDTNTRPEDWPARPGLFKLTSVHNHVLGKGPESPVDNLMNDAPIIVITLEKLTAEGVVWVYPPRSDKPEERARIADGRKRIGIIRDGHFITPYDTVAEMLSPDRDIYAEMERPRSSGGGGCSFWCWAGRVGTAIGVGFGAIVTGDIIGGESSVGTGCCPGRPAGTDYDPRSDPTQVCRRPDGTSCS